MTINQADIFDYASWINMAPDFDWDNLVPVPEPDPTPDPEVSTET